MFFIYYFCYPITIEAIVNDESNIIQHTDNYNTFPKFADDLFASSIFSKPAKASHKSIHNIENPYFIIIDNVTVQHYSDLGNGLGNLLAQYWLSMSVAYLNHLNWILIEPESSQYTFSDKYRKFFWANCSETQEFECLFSNYLPKQIDFMNKYDADHVNGAYKDFDVTNIFNIYMDTMMRKYDNTKEPVFKYPFWQKILLFVINEPFLNDVIVPIMQNIFKYQVNIDQSIINHTNNSVVIHYRCGDLLTGSAAPGYGIFGISVIKNVFKHWKVNTERIRIISTGNEQCKWLMNELVDYMLNDPMFEGFKIELQMDGSINSDLYEIATAKYVLCGYSTFCYYAAFGNPNNIAFIHVIKNVDFDPYIEANIVPKRYFPIHRIAYWNSKQNGKDVNFLPLKGKHDLDVQELVQWIFSH